jgi:predicted dehydrogenase
MLARSQAAQIHSYGSNAATGIEAEDTAVISAKFENGMLGSIIASWATPRQPLLFSVYGPEGSIECGRAFEGLVLMDKSHDSASTKKIPVPGTDTIEEECRAFVKSIVEGKTDPRISPEEGRKDIEFIEAAYASMSKGGVVDLPMV